MSGFKYTAKFETAMKILANHRKCSSDTNTLVVSIVIDSKCAGFVSESQAELCGMLYKRIVNNGVYIKHDWWN